MSSGSEFPSDSSAYTFFFHPFQMLEEKMEKKEDLGWAVFAVFTHAILTICTAGFWQIPFWAADYFENRKVDVVDKEKNPQAGRVDDISKGKITGEAKMDTKEDVVENPIPLELIPVLDRTPKFNDYRLDVPLLDGVPVVLTGMKVSHMNLFLRAIFEKDVTTMPGGDLFRYEITPEQFLARIQGKPDEEVVSFCARGVRGAYRVITGYDKHDRPIYKEKEVEDLAEVYGDKTFRMTYGEIKSVLASQTICTSSLLPLVFYEGLKEAMAKDDIVILPGSDGKPVKLSEVTQTHMKNYVKEVAKDPKSYGFKDAAHFKNLVDKTLYQIGSMVVKSEDYYLFADGKGHTLEREPGGRKPFRLINMCGIRGVTAKNTPKKDNPKIMTEDFITALVKAKSGYGVVPAVGMGVWRGDPDLYWPAFLDAVVLGGGSFKNFLVNPNHQPTASGKFEGYTGQEFQVILNQYQRKYKDDPVATENLGKIINLATSGKDILVLADELQQEFPDENVSLINASDPDVTVGRHVGEYTNNCPHTKTTEENYSRVGTNILCFEDHTNVHLDPTRLSQIFYSEDGQIEEKSLAEIRL